MRIALAVLTAATLAVLALQPVVADPLPPLQVAEPRAVADGVTYEHYYWADPDEGLPGPTNLPDETHVHVLRVDREAFTGRAETVLAEGRVTDKETVPSMAARTGALAAINGGFFIVNDSFGTPGDLMGVSVIDGELVSEAVGARSAVVIRGDDLTDAWTTQVSTTLTVTAEDGATRELDGLNRAPGIVRSCGGVGGDVLDGEVTHAPVHDYTCHDDSELTLLRPVFGGTVPPADRRVLLDAEGVVLGPLLGQSVPDDHQVLLATGDAAEWIDAHAGVGTRVRVTETVTTPDGPLDLDGLDVINGGPLLVRDGVADVTWVEEGFGRIDAANGWVNNANPRAAVAWTPDATLLVTVDGRQAPDGSGLDLPSFADLLIALGATDAVNLDGGGSVTMTIGEEVVNSPSDGTNLRTPFTRGTPRPVGDALVLLSE